LRSDASLLQLAIRCCCAAWAGVGGFVVCANVGELAMAAATQTIDAKRNIIVSLDVVVPHSIGLTQVVSHVHVRAMHLPRQSR
jgi:hypothetical protein